MGILDKLTRRIKGRLFLLFICSYIFLTVGAFFLVGYALGVHNPDIRYMNMTYIADEASTHVTERISVQEHNGLFNFYVDVRLWSVTVLMLTGSFFGMWAGKFFLYISDEKSAMLIFELVYACIKSSAYFTVFLLVRYIIRLLEGKDEFR